MTFLLQSELKSSTIEPFKVCIRIRPFLHKEILLIESKQSILSFTPQTDKDPIKHAIFKTEDNLLFVFDPALNYLTNNEKTYMFDTIFTEEHNNLNVFESAMKPIINNVLLGYNSTALAYGVTGTGKTHTIFGDLSSNVGSGENGVVLHSSDYLFEKLKVRESEINTKVTVSYLEIYNETVIDLLADKTKPLMIIEDSYKGVIVPDLNEYTVTCSNDLIKLIVQGNNRRIMAPTNQNKFSSRSHAILQLSVEQKSKIRGIKEQVLFSKFLIVDLAGSERGGLEKGLRREEGANINKSLLSLGNCINLLSDKTKKGTFIPYRDSKLTRLLKDSLGGNILTVMIACVSPAPMTYDESVNTLNYATRARKIQKKINRNVKEVSAHISQYKDIIKSLQMEVAQLREIIKTQEINLSQKISITDEKNGEVEDDGDDNNDDELSEILPILNLNNNQNDHLASKNNNSFISNKSGNRSIFTSNNSKGDNKNAQTIDVNLYKDFVTNNNNNDNDNLNRETETNNITELQNQVEQLKTDKVILETFMSSKQYFYNSYNNNNNKSIDEKYNTIKVYYDKYIELINDKLIENIEQNMILKFNLKEIEELNNSNEQNIQLLQNQIDLLLQAKIANSNVNNSNKDYNEVDNEGINSDISKLNEEIDNIKGALNENNQLKGQLTDSLGRNLKMKRMLKKILFSLLSSCSNHNTNDKIKYKEILKENNELVVNNKDIEGKLRNAMSQESKKNEMLLNTKREIEMLRNKIKEKDRRINELENRNSLISSNHNLHNINYSNFFNNQHQSQTERNEKKLRHKNSTPQLKTLSINQFGKIITNCNNLNNNNIKCNNNIKIQPMTTHATTTEANNNVKKTIESLQNKKYIINQTHPIVNNNISKITQPNNKIASSHNHHLNLHSNPNLISNNINNESNHSSKGKTNQVNKGIQEFEALIYKTKSGMTNYKPPQIKTNTSPRITTQVMQSNPNITLSISNYSYNNEIETKSDTDNIASSSNRTDNKYLTHKTNQLEEARLKNKIKKEQTFSVNSIVSSKAEDFIKEYTKKKINVGNYNKIDDAINSQVNIENNTVNESQTFIINNNEDYTESIINNDDESKYSIHESFINSLCESIKDRKLTKYLTTNPL